MPPRDRSIAPPPRVPPDGPRSPWRPFPSERPVLLASVADPEEAALALRLRVGIVDLKDPSRGTLGACRPEIWRAAAALRDGIAPRTPLSAALGDIRSRRDADRAAARASLAASLGIDFVKVALSGIRDPEEAAVSLAAIVRAARGSARVIAVICVDEAPAGALTPRDLPRVTALSAADGCLLDTAAKEAGSLMERLPLREVALFVTECRARGLIAALAGSLCVAHLPALAAIAPDVLGARGALCRLGREGRLDRGRLIMFHDALRVARRAVPAGEYAATQGRVIRPAPAAPLPRSRER